MEDNRSSSMLDVIAIIVAITGLLGAIAGLLKLWYDVRELHKAVNSRLDLLVKTVSEAERAKGKLEGAAEYKKGSE
jgi:hypothetical protein